MADWASDYDFTTCCNCGCRFAVPKDFMRGKRNSKAAFYCPNGHELAFKESEADLLRRERDKLKQNEAYLNDRLTAERERAAKAEAATKRLKKRASAGTCPCCQRTFANMAAHMKTQHPELIREGGAKVVPLKRPVSVEGA